MISIRKALVSDLLQISEIYNDAVANTVATFDTSPKTCDEQDKWFRSHDSRHPIFVAESNDQVVGWIALSEWCDRKAYSDTAELSIYVKTGHRGRGIGQALTATILQAGRNQGLHTIIARIETSNETIIHVLRKSGFKQIGVMQEVGRKFDRILDVMLMQIIL